MSVHVRPLDALGHCARFDTDLLESESFEPSAVGGRAVEKCPFGGPRFPEAVKCVECVGAIMTWEFAMISGAAPSRAERAAPSAIAGEVLSRDNVVTSRALAPTE